MGMTAGRRRNPAPFLAVLALALAGGCDTAADPEVVSGPDRVIRVAPVEVVPGAREIRISGVTRAARRAVLSFLVEGDLAERPVELGEAVAEGQLLARVHNPSLAPAVAASEAQVRELDARLDQLGRDVARAESLREQGLISQEEVERVRTERAATAAARDLAEARLQEARNRLAQARLAAPFPGTVDAVFLEPGEFVAPGVPMLRLSGAGPLEVELGVPETLIARFEPGREVIIELPFAGGRRVGGTVRHVGEGAGEAGRLFPVEVALDDREGVMPGMTAELVLETREEDVMVVPLAAVLDPGTGRPRVYRLAGDRIEQVEVVVGKLYGEKVEVRGTLAPGDQVAVTGLASLVPGQAVRVAR